MPVQAEPGVSRFSVGAVGEPLQAIPLAGGGTLDATRLPFAFATEEVLLATNVNGRARLECGSAKYAVILKWDPAVFTSCMLWFSNRGRTAYPWNGRFLALGIEPVTSAFGLGTAVSANPLNPLEIAGVSTAKRFGAGARLITQYSMAVESLS
jgi:hypothetical protein